MEVPLLTLHKSWYLTLAIGLLSSACGDDDAKKRARSEPAKLSGLPLEVKLEVNEDKRLQMTLQEVFGEGAETFTYAVVNDATHGHFELLAGIDYRPKKNFSGNDQITLEISDGKESIQPILLVAVKPVNDEPVSNPATFQGVEDFPVSGTLSGTDVESPRLTFALSRNGGKGNVVLKTDGTFVYTPAADANGRDTFQFTVNDGTATSTPSEVRIEMSPVNDPPAAHTARMNGIEDSALYDAVSAFDPDTPETLLVFSLVTEPTRGTIEFSSNGSFKYLPDSNQNGEDSFTFRVNDGEFGSAVAAVFLNILAVNDRPIAKAASVTVGEDLVLEGQLEASDIDGDTVTFHRASNPLHGTLIFNLDGRFTYRPANNFHGTDSFTFDVYDGKDASAPQTVNITVEPVNDLPVFTRSAWSIDEDSALDTAMEATDVDGDALTYSLIAAPSNGTASVSAAGRLTYQPNANFYGIDTFTVQASDGNGGVTPKGITVTVTPINDAPWCTDMALVTDEDTVLRFSPSAADIDSGMLTHSIATFPHHGTLATNPDGTFSYEPAGNYFGSDSFSYRSSDGALECTQAYVNIAVLPVNDPPVVTSTAFSFNNVHEDTSVGGTFTGTDIEGDALQWKVSQQPANGTVEISGSSFTYTPHWDFDGSDSFSFLANDGIDDSSNTGTFSVKYSPQNDIPVGLPQILELPSPSALYSGNVTATDPDGDSLTFRAATSYPKLTLSTDGVFTYTGSSSTEEGWEIYAIQASDGKVSDRFPLAIKLGHCVDQDGDGYGQSCLAGTDCDDTDPTIFTGAPELPGDGVAQSCSADLEVNNTSGVFVSAATGNDLNPGTQAYPVATISMGLTRAAGAKAVFIAAGDYSDDTGAALLNANVSLFGGYNPTDWSRDISANKTTLEDNGIQVPAGTAIAIQGITLKSIVVQGTVTLANNFIGKAGGTAQFVFKAVAGRTIAARNQLIGPDADYGRALAVQGTAAVVFTDNDIHVGNAKTNAYIHGIELIGTGNATFDRNRLWSKNSVANSVYPFKASNSGSALVMRNNTFESSPNASEVIDITGYKAVAMLNNTFDGLVKVSGDGLSIMANNIFLNGLSLYLRSTFLHNNLILPSKLGWLLQADYRNKTYSLREINGCRFPECAASSGNLSVDPILLAGTYRPATTSPVVDAGISPAQMTRFFINHSDLVGVTRPIGGGWDIGAWEVK
jgi:VCBS repeat-containing protein